MKQRGAALLAAMLTVTLVATFAAAALWQQWRAVEVEAAERTRVQAAWILLGALDWSRLILREDARGSTADYLAEPWAVPLQEARLSTFLAAQNNAQGSALDGDLAQAAQDAFLSGQITDMQSRLNLRNLLVTDSTLVRSAQGQLARLFERLNLPQQDLSLLEDGLTRANGTGDTAPLMPQTVQQLTWLGLSPATVARLEPYVALLPVPTPVNLNTAGVDVLVAAISELDQASAQRIVQARASRYFRSMGDVIDLLGRSDDLGGTNVVSTNSSYFEVRGRLRLGASVVEERTLVQRNSNLPVVLWRQRNALPPAVAPVTAVE